MLAKNFPEKIGFTEEECRLCRAYIDMVGDEIEPLAKEYMEGTRPMYEVLEDVHKLERADVHIYTLDLVFVLLCSGYLEESYHKKGIPEAMFTNLMKDIKYKLDECMEVHQVFGVFVVSWYDLHLRGELMAFGRLQIHSYTYGDDPFTVFGTEIKAGDKVLNCHIPSSGPLTKEALLDSYRQIYAWYPEYRIGDVLPIRCGSWLLYPEYDEVFACSKNISEFRSHFNVFSKHEKEEFSDCWRVFGVDAEPVDELPEKTSLQRAFKAYMKKGGTFGSGIGFLLFDGEKVIKA